MDANKKQLILETFGTDLFRDHPPSTAISRLLTLALIQGKSPKLVVQLANKITDDKKFNESTIRKWMAVIREQLGMPKPKPGKISNEHCDALRKWLEQHGAPKPEAVLDGYFDSRLEEAADLDKPIPRDSVGPSIQGGGDSPMMQPQDFEALRADGWVKLGEGEVIYVRQVPDDQGPTPGASVITDVWCGVSAPGEGKGRWIRQAFQPFPTDSNSAPPPR